MAMRIYERARFLVSRLRAVFRRGTPHRVDLSHTEPAEAYLAACIAAPFFCYISPSLYGLDDTDTFQQQRVTQDEEVDQIISDDP